MAKETRVEKVASSASNSVIDVYGAFQWEVLSTQEVVDNYMTRSFDTVYQNRDKWTNITFQRDTAIPNYKEIKALNDEYDHAKKWYNLNLSSYDYLEKQPIGRLFNYRNILLGFMLMIFPGVLMIKSNKAKKAKYKKNLEDKSKLEAELAKNKKTMNDALEKARSLT